MGSSTLHLSGRRNAIRLSSPALSSIVTLIVWPFLKIITSPNANISVQLSLLRNGLSRVLSKWRLAFGAIWAPYQSRANRFKSSKELRTYFLFLPLSRRESGSALFQHRCNTSEFQALYTERYRALCKRPRLQSPIERAKTDPP